MKTPDHHAELETLMAYLDGELPENEAEQVRAHLAGCVECQEMQAEMADVSGRLKAWEVDGAPSTFRAPAPKFGGSARRWLPVAASVVLVTGAGFAWLATWQEELAPSQMAVAPPEGTISQRSIDTGLPGAVADRATMKIVLGSAPVLFARTARLTIVTDRFDASRAEMEAIIRRVAGFTGRLLVTGTAEQGRALTATLQIPSGRLDETLTALKAVGRVDSEGVDGEDVTQQSVDLDARLENARTSEKRLTAILVNRTGDLDDVLAVEREIARVRGEIESMEAQRKALDRRVTYATVEIQMTEEKRAAVDLGPQPLSSRFADALVRGWNDVLGTGVALGLLFARLTPAIVVLLLLSAPVLLLRRRAG